MSHQRQRATMMKNRWPLLVLLLAFALQMGYLAELQGMFPDRFGQQPFCGVDSVAHLQRAKGLLDGSLPGELPYYFIPLYPLYLATLKTLTGDSLLLPIVFQALFQIVGIAAVYSLGRLIFSSLTGLLAALGMATYRYYIFYLPCFDQALLTVPALTLTLFFLVKFHRQQRAWYLLFSGIMLALAILSRPTILLVFPAIVLWLYFVSSSEENWLPALGILIKNVALLMIPFLIFVSPITWHNYQVSGRFILLSDNFGVNFFTGNNPDAYGLDSLAHIQSQPAVIRFEAVMPQVERGETTLTTEVWHYITHQPADWLELMGRKVWLWFGEQDEPLVSPYFPLSVAQSSLLASLPLEWQAVAIMALLGLFFAFQAGNKPRLILLMGVYGIFSATTILFFIQLRFRLPFLPFVLLLAASLITTVRRPSPYFWPVFIVLCLLYPFIPTLWIFILIFAVLNLWPGRLGLLITTLFYMMLVALWHYLLIAPVSQTIDHYLGPPLAGPTILGQTIQLDCNRFHRLEVTLGTFEDQPHDHPVTFYLATDPSAQEIIYSETFAGSEIQDYQQKQFNFPPLPDSAGDTFFFFLASPNATLDNALTARGYADTPVDRYPQGRAWVGPLGGLQPFQADFAFAAYCDLSLSDRF